MLKNIPALLSPELLQVLAAMGHGDDIAVVDANFPAASKAQRLLRVDGSTATDVLSAILALFPIDDFTDDAVRCMEVVATENQFAPITDDFMRIIKNHQPCSAIGLSRDNFYIATQAAYAVVITGERRLYGNVLLRKGVVTESDLV